MTRVVQPHQQPPLFLEQVARLRFPRAYVERLADCWVRYRFQAHGGFGGDRGVRPPEWRGGEDGLPALHKVLERERQRSRATGGRDGHAGARELRPVPLGQRQQKGRVTGDRGVGRDLHGREFAPKRHHAVVHHQLAVVVKQRAHGGVDNWRSRGRPLLGGRVEREDQIVAGKALARVEEMSAHGMQTNASLTDRPRIHQSGGGPFHYHCCPNVTRAFHGAA